MGQQAIYMQVTVDGEVLKGQCTDVDHKDWCNIRRYYQELSYSFDARESKANSDPVHGPFVVIKEIDSASPNFYEALVKRKVVDKVELQFYRDNPKSGLKEHYFQIVMEDGRVVWARPHTPMPSEMTEFTPPNMEEIGFAYRKISWDWLHDATKATTFDFDDQNA